MIILIILSIILIYTTYFIIISHIHYNKYVFNKPNIDVNNLEVGDILFRRSAFFDYFQPGYFTHAAIFLGYDNNNIGHVSEAFIFGGVRTFELSAFIKRGTTSVTKLKNISETEKTKLINWCKSKLETEFSFNAFGKNKVGNAFYCSEYVWAGFMYLGIDLDSDTFAEFNVTPQEIYDSNLIEHLGIVKIE